jgi:hypothetical protein
MNAVTSEEASTGVAVKPVSDAAVFEMADRMETELRQSYVWYQKALEIGAKGVPAWEAERLESLRPGKQTWQTLAFLADADPHAYARKWEQIRRVAEVDVAEGRLAARTIESEMSKPLDRARFEAMRDALAADWQPRGGVEWMLLDQLAVAYCQQLSWTERLTQCSDEAAARDTRDLEGMRDRNNEQFLRDGSWLRPRLSDAECVEQAMTMVERWNKMALRVLRAMRDLRRYAPPVIVNNGGQINVAHQQVNHCPAEERASPAREEPQARAVHDV